MVRSLITGVSGFVASHLARYLLEQGEEVIGTYRWQEDLSRLKDIKDRLNMMTMDLIDAKSCRDVISAWQPDYIYHLAAESFVPDSFKAPALYIQVNTIGTLNLLEAVENMRGRYGYGPVIHLCSSSEVYGQVEANEVPIKETNPLRPQNPYGVSKLGADMLGYVYWKCYGLKIIRTRMFTHTGPGRTMLSAESSFARQIALIEKGLQKPVVKVGNLESVRTIADVRDAVKAYYILMRKCCPGEVYNIAGTEVMEVGDILNYLISLSPAKDKITVRVDSALLRPADVNLQIVDTSKFFKETGWQPEIPFEKTMQDLLDWWRANV
jgi:GDP-mannose 4,6-dehydratase